MTEKETFYDRLTCFFVLAYGALTSGLALMRHANFGLRIGDLAIYSQAIWGNLHGLFMKVTLLKHTHDSEVAISFFNLHFAPILVLVSPIFKLVPLPEGLIVFKCLLIAAAGFVLYEVGKRCLEAPQAFFVAMLFLISPNSMGCIHDSFHLDYFGPLIFFLVIYFYLKESLAPFVISCILFLMIKESFAPTLLILGLSLFIKRDRSKQWALWPIALSLLYGAAAYFVFDVLHQAARPDPTVDFRPMFFHNLTPASLLGELFGARFVDHLWFFVHGFKFLTFLTPAFLLWAPQAAINLALRLPFGDHYGTLLSAIMFLTLLPALQKINLGLSKKSPGFRSAVLALIFLGGSFTSFESLKILNPKHYTPNPRKGVLKAVLKLVPEEASVSASEIFLPRLSRRKELDFVNHEKFKSYYEYILLDLNREDSTHIEWPVVEGSWKPFLEKTDRYELLYNKENIRLYRRKSLDSLDK